MKTRERILRTSLALFNECGEPNITTIDISNELDISPGNLYYHFKGKEQIITELYLRFEAELLGLLNSPDRHNLVIRDLWLYLLVVFETISKYRFLYRDLADLLANNDRIRTRFCRILSHKRKTFLEVCERLIDAEIMIIEKKELQALADNVVVTATYWLNYQSIGNRQQYDHDHLNQGVFQVMAQVAPFLKPELRRQLNEQSSLLREMSFA